MRAPGDFEHTDDENDDQPEGDDSSTGDVGDDLVDGEPLDDRAVNDTERRYGDDESPA